MHSRLWLPRSPRTTRRRFLSVLIGVTFVASLAAGCSSSSGGKRSKELSTFDVLAEDILIRDKDYTAPAGLITIGYDNLGKIPHTLVIKGVEPKTFRLAVKKGGERVVGSVTLSAGEYTMFCDIPGHQATMTVTLTVT